MPRRGRIAALAIGTAALLAARHAAPPSGPPTGGPITLSSRGLSWSHEVLGLGLLPGEALNVAASAPGGDGTLVMTCDRGAVEELGPSQWRYVAPEGKGLATLRISSLATGRSSRIHVFVMTPFGELRDGKLGSFEVGSYPAEPLRGLDSYLPPRGFVAVTEANQDTLVAPHFRLRQLLCKQAGGYPKYIVLEERLLLALEQILARLHELGHEAPTLTIMSGYRTPTYNAALKDVVYSRHQWGDAADIFVDVEPPLGRMDDLDADGTIGLGDAQLLHDIVDQLDVLGGGVPFLGGLGLYDATATHPEFVHVDVRGSRARWRG